MKPKMTYLIALENKFNVVSRNVDIYECLETSLK